MAEQGEAVAAPAAATEAAPAVATEAPAVATHTPVAEVGVAESGAEGENPNYAAGYVFLCRTATQLECMEKLLFGARDKDFPRMHATIGEKTQIFLINVNNGTMIGTYLPSGAPEMGIEAGAFGQTGGFDAQLRVQPMTDPLAAVKIEKRIHGGPKTAFEVEEIQLMFLSGKGVDPWTVDNEKIGEYTQPAQTSGFGGKGKWKGRPPWMNQMAHQLAAVMEAQAMQLAGAEGGASETAWGGMNVTNPANLAKAMMQNWRPSWPAGGKGAKGKRNTFDAAPWPAANTADPTNGGRVPATVEVSSAIAEGIAMGEAQPGEKHAAQGAPAGEPDSKRPKMEE